MKATATKVTCPKCGSKIDVSDLLYQQVDEELKKKYEDELAKERKGFEKERDALAKREEQLKADKKKQSELVAGKVKDQLAKDRKVQEKAVKAEIKKEQADALKVLKAELGEKSKELKEFNKTKAELERLQREKDEMQEKMAAEAERQLNEKLKEATEEIRKAEGEKQQLRIAEREEVIRQLNLQLKEAQRKAEQGSTQLQGEVQELAIECWLREQFPLDSVEEVKKGAKGADCLQTVNTQSRQSCGTILYESKRTKAFQPAWLPKFKDDVREKGADVGVLVNQPRRPLGQFAQEERPVVTDSDLIEDGGLPADERLADPLPAVGVEIFERDGSAAIHRVLPDPAAGEPSALVHGPVRIPGEGARREAEVPAGDGAAVERVSLARALLDGLVLGGGGEARVVAAATALDLRQDRLERRRRRHGLTPLMMMEEPARHRAPGARAPAERRGRDGLHGNSDGRVAVTAGHPGAADRLRRRVWLSISGYGCRSGRERRDSAALQSLTARSGSPIL